MTTIATYEEATTAPTQEEKHDDLLADCVDQGCTVAGWSDSAPQRAMVEGNATALAFEAGMRVQLAKASTLRGCAELDDTWVDQGLTWYQVARIAATQAVWEVPLLIAQASAPVTIGPTSRILLQVADGTIFECSQGSAVTLNAASNYRGRVAFTARLVGTTGNQVPGAMAQARVIAGPAGLSVDSEATAALTTAARDAETNETAIARAEGRWGTLSGVLTAGGWRYVLCTPEAGGQATITRVFVDDTNPNGPGTTAIYLANAAGPASADEVAAAQTQASGLTIAGTGGTTVAACVAETVELVVDLLVVGNPLASAQAVTALVQLAGAVTGDILYLDAITATLMAIPGVRNVPTMSVEEDIVRPRNGVIVLSPTVTQA